jgi:hypothetical protein
MQIPEIDTAVYLPAEGKPGYSRFSHNMTLDQLQKAIRKEMPPALLLNMDNFGMPHWLNKLDYLPSYSSADCRLQVSWTPGGSEGYYISIHAEEATFKHSLVWSAKTFDLMAAIALSAWLTCAFTHTGGHAENEIGRIFALLDTDSATVGLEA